jgi:2'-5' RNA ligase
MAGVTASFGPRRRAIVLFLPGHVEREVDRIRRRWDPVMAGRIDAHLTVVHDVADVDRAHDLLAAVAALRPGFEFTLTETACWGPAKWGIYLCVEDHDGGVQALHDDLAAVENPRWLRTTYRPHVTLVHGRTVTEAIAEEAWAELTGYHATLRGRIDTVHLVESRPGGWVTIDRFDLAAERVPAGPPGTALPNRPIRAASNRQNRGP